MKMIKYELRIKLLSDLCCGTGEGDGSTIDCLTAFDEFGLPYIPAKRLKGLLRMQAEFLQAYASTDENTIHKLFGSINGKSGMIRVNNARIINRNHAEADMYFSLRAQTAIEDSGTAKQGSLRITQVVDKGNEFCADIILRDANGNMMELLENCTKTLRHIGMNKNRGFGEVKCDLVKISENNINALTFKDDDSSITLTYKLKLLDDVVISAGANMMTDYISGSMVQGAFMRYVKEFKGFDKFLKRTIFSDAYIDGAEPIPFSYVAIKNQTDKVFSLADAYIKEDYKQYVPVSGYYKIEDKKFIRQKVQVATEFHYSTKTRDIFTYKKILKDQEFEGSLTAPKSIVDVVKEVISQESILYLGASSSAQYARCEISFGEMQAEKSIEVEKTMIAELLTDTVIRDEYGAISGNVKNLIKVFNVLFDFEESETEIYTKTIRDGGFNNLRKLPIPQYVAFARGSVLVFKNCKSKTNKPISEKAYFKDITFGGYGQYKLRAVSNINEYEGCDK